MAKKKRRFGRVRKLPSGRYQVRYLGPDGILRPAPETFRTETDANRWLVAREAEILEGRWTDPDAGKQTVQAWAERWYESAAPGLKFRTRTSYESLMRSRIFPAFGEMTVADVKPMMVAEWVARMRRSGLSPSRIRQAYRLLSQIMRSAVDNDLIAVTPCRGIRLPAMPHTEPHILTLDEVDRLASVMRAPHGLIVELLAYGGLRIGEAFALRRADVDLTNGRLTVDESLGEWGGVQEFDTTKNHQRRVVALPTFLIDALKLHLDEHVKPETKALLFLGATGNPLRYNAWRTTHFDKAVKAAGLVDVTPHDLRATHATWVTDKHGVMAAAQRLGHSNASVTTRHYARAVEGRDGEIAKDLGTARDQARKGHDKTQDQTRSTKGASDLRKERRRKRRSHGLENR
ncbi:tyrosine-type recombinase/integrase [Yinghuangia sp. YIM S09857]|uniref:tyrosine-type recombinase/integrase n=1 Tax=Yinghuangia sp. YIM S09857 TaxID=3436929 RepID=UPI003F52F349